MYHIKRKNGVGHIVSRCASQLSIMIERKVLLHFIFSHIQSITQHNKRKTVLETLLKSFRIFQKIQTISLYIMLTEIEERLATCKSAPDTICWK